MAEATGGGAAAGGGSGGGWAKARASGAGGSAGGLGVGSNGSATAGGAAGAATAGGSSGAPAAAEPSIALGSRVVCPTRPRLGTATVRYIGRTNFAPEMWIGLQLDPAHWSHATHNGTVHGVTYFSAPPGATKPQCTFVKLSLVRLEASERKRRIAAAQARAEALATQRISVGQRVRVPTQRHLGIGIARFAGTVLRGGPYSRFVGIELSAEVASAGHGTSYGILNGVRCCRAAIEYADPAIRPFVFLPEAEVLGADEPDPTQQQQQQHPQLHQPHHHQPQQQQQQQQQQPQQPLEQQAAMRLNDAGGLPDDGGSRLSERFFSEYEDA